MKIRVPFKIWRLFRIWRLEYLATKAKKSLEALRKFTAGHVTAHPYSMVFAALQDRLAEVQYAIVVLETSTSWEHYFQLVLEHEEAKAKEQFDAVMKETDEFLENLGPDFQAKLNEETDGALEKWLKLNRL